MGGHATAFEAAPPKSSSRRSTSFLTVAPARVRDPSPDRLLRRLSEPSEASERIADLVKRIRPRQARRLLAMSPSDRLDRAFALMELAHDAGRATRVR